MLQPFSQNKKINWAAGSAKPVNLKWFKRNSRGSKKLKAFLHAGIAGPIFVLNIYTPRAQEVIFVGFFFRPAASKILAVRTDTCVFLRW